MEREREKRSILPPRFFWCVYIVHIHKRCFATLLSPSFPLSLRTDGKAKGPPVLVYLEDFNIADNIGGEKGKGGDNKKKTPKGTRNAEQRGERKEGSLWKTLQKTQRKGCNPHLGAPGKFDG